MLSNSKKFLKSSKYINPLGNFWKRCNLMFENMYCYGLHSDQLSNSLTKVNIGFFERTETQLVSCNYVIHSVMFSITFNFKFL